MESAFKAASRDIHLISKCHGHLASFLVSNAEHLPLFRRYPQNVCSINLIVVYCSQLLVTTKQSFLYVEREDGTNIAHNLIVLDAATMGLQAVLVTMASKRCYD